MRRRQSFHEIGFSYLVISPKIGIVVKKLKFSPQIKDTCIYTW